MTRKTDDLKRFITIYCCAIGEIPNALVEVEKDRLTSIFYLYGFDNAVIGLARSWGGLNYKKLLDKIEAEAEASFDKRNITEKRRITMTETHSFSEADTFKSIYASITEQGVLTLFSEEKEQLEKLQPSIQEALLVMEGFKLDQPLKITDEFRKYTEQRVHLQVPEGDFLYLRSINLITEGGTARTFGKPEVIGGVEAKSYNSYWIPLDMIRRMADAAITGLE